MPRWLWWTPLAGLTVLVAVLGLRLGWVAVSLTETEVIEGQAARYLAEHGEGADVTDCQAEPGRSAFVWMTVECRPDASPFRYRYHVSHLGSLLFWERFVPEFKGPLS